nr:sensor histidine kinase [Nonomuraea sp. FMUSA5-5]
MLAQRPPPWLLILVDTVVAALLALASTASPPELAADAGSVALCWLVVAPVAVRRVWPEPAYYSALLIGIAVLFVQVNRLLPAIVVALAIYPLATGRPVRRSAIALVTGLLVTGGAALLSALSAAQRADGWPDPVLIVGMVWLVVAASWSLGTTARTRREFAAREARQEARRQAEQAAADERLRIVRELHDVVAHSMSMITVKAGVAAKVLDKHPAEGRKALLAIEELGRGSLMEMRQLLGVLRAADGAPERAPLPGLADLPALVERAAEAGVRVDLSVSGTLPDSMAASVYRIVQEAITNVVRHAAPAHCQADVSVVGRTVRISVVDDGPGQRVLPDDADESGQRFLLGRPGESRQRVLSDCPGGSGQGVQTDRPGGSGQGVQTDRPSGSGQRFLTDRSGESGQRLLPSSPHGSGQRVLPHRSDGSGRRVPPDRSDGSGQRVLPGRSGGHGLVGMRERVMMYGGTFEAGPRPEGGFGVHASWEIS